MFSWCVLRFSSRRDCHPLAQIRPIATLSRPLLFCGVCDTGFMLPHKGKLTKVDPEFECPLCNFQASVPPATPSAAPARWLEIRGFLCS